MADVNANIDINIDSSNALAQLKSLQRQISQFHTSIAKSSEAAALAQRGLQKNLLNSINAIGAFTAEMRTVRTSAESFTDSLEKNKFSMREYFRYAGASTKTFGRLFKSEFDTIGKVAEERVKRLQTQYIKMGRDTNGAMRAIAVMPTELNMKDYTTQVQMAAQKQALFNQLMRQGSTNLLNFGKNTQWAGRQLMVGFTLPLMAVGTAATRTFMEMEAQALRFRKVYGDLFTPREETQQALDNITELGKQFTRYGVAVSQTVGLAADAAAAGFQGLDLQRQTTEATRLSILGQVDSQKALETTISLQNAFKMSSQDLAGAIDFLNAVENQTVVSLDDITTAIPKVAPVIQQLGGDVKDLAFFIGALKEGGVNASEGANALKSGLGALINPTEKAAGMLADMGININQIVEKNQGNLRATVVEFARALDTLDPLSRARAIEQLFGKFQFARLSTLFDNVTNQAGQAGRILDLAGTSIEDLAALSQQELGMTADSAMNKFRKSVEDLKVALVPVGEAFLQAVTPIIDFVGNVLDRFNNLSDGTKRIITLLTVGLGAVGPVLLMTFGLIANGVANLIKMFLTLRAGYQRITGQSQILGEQTQYLTSEQIDAAAAAHSLDQTHAKLTQTFNAEAAAINKLIQAYNSAAGAARNFAINNPGMMMPPRGGRKLASGIVSVPGPKGAGDVVPAMLSPGEAVIPTDMAKKYAPLIQGMIADNIPGFQMGTRAKGRTGTEGTNVRIPGGFAAAHFGGSRSMTGTELLGMLEGRTDKMAESLRTMVQSMESVDQPITVFTNEVVAMSSELNEALGKTGSGKRVSLASARSELTSVPLSQVRDIELQRQLEQAGVPLKDIKNINQQITDEISVGFTKLGDITEVTAEDIDKLVSAAYKKVADTDARVDAAYKKMQEVTALTDPNILARRPVTKESYKQFRKNDPRTGQSPYFMGMERMIGAGNVPYNPEAQFRITNPMAAQLGLSSANAAKIYKQFSDEVKLKLSTLRGDIAAFTVEFEKQAEIAGLKTGNAYKGGIVKSDIKDPYVESRDRQSPHRLADNDGRDDAKAYSDARDNELRRRTRTRRVATAPQGAPPPIVPGGVPMSVLNMAYAENTLRDKVRRQQEQTEIMARRMTKLNRAFMSGTFALSALSGVASMAGGGLGKFSELLFQVSAPLFAISSLIQLFTGKPVISFLAGLGNLKIGALSIGIAAVTLGAKLLKDAKEKERIATEGLANVITNTKDKMELFRNFFNIQTRERSSSTAVISSSTQRGEPRQKTQALKASEDFKKLYEKEIQALTQESEQRALISLQSLALDLSGMGVGKDVIESIITAITELAGRSELLLKFKQIDVSTEEGAKAATDAAKQIVGEFNAEFEKGVKTIRKGYGGAKGGAVTLLTKEITQLTSGQTKQLTLGSQELANMLAGISGQFKAAEIDAGTYNKRISEILNTTYGVKEVSRLLTETIIKLNPEFGNATSGVTEYKSQLLLLRAAILGVTVAETILSGLMSKNMMERRAAQIELEKLLAGQTAIQEKENKEVKDRIKTGQAEKNALLERIKNLRNQTNAYIILRNAKIDEKTATELSNDAEIAAMIIKNKSGAALKNLIKLVRQYQNEVKRSVRVQDKLADPTTRFKNEMERLQAAARLREKMIDIEYAPKIQKQNDLLKEQQKALSDVNKEIEKVTRSQIEPIQAVINANSLALEKIALQEDAINEKYNKQIDALDKIAAINQDIANIQKQRMSIADALSRGDISAAAQLGQDARAEQAQSAIARQREGVTAVRDAQLAALGRNNIERQNKELQLQINIIEATQLQTLQTQKRTIEDTIQSIESNIEALNREVEQLKNAAVYAGRTKQDIDDTVDLIALAEAAGIEFTKELLDQATNAERLAAALKLSSEYMEILAGLSLGGADGAAEGGDSEGPGAQGPAGKGKGGKGSKGSGTRAQKPAGKLPKGGGKGASGSKLVGSVRPTGILTKGGGKAASGSKLVGGKLSNTISRSSMPFGGKTIVPKNKMYGGIIPKYMQFGGRAVGSDTVPAMLTPGEFVMNRAATRTYRPLLERMNESKYPSMLGGATTNMPVTNISSSVSDNSTAVYNYNLGFNINNGNSNPNEVARAVMREIKNVDLQRIKRQRF